MNVAALLQDSPSDDHRRRLPHRDRDPQPPPQQLPHPIPQHLPPPPHHSPTQDRLYDRDRERLPPPLSHISPRDQHLPPPPSHHSTPAPRHPHPPSPHHAYPPQDYPPVQRAPLPPSSSFLHDPYEPRHRRPPQEHFLLPHDLSQQHHHHGPPSALGPPGPPQPYLLEPRSSGSLPPLQRGPPPPPPLMQHHHHAHTLPSTPSAMYMPPPARPAPLHIAPPGPHKLSPPGPGAPLSHSHSTIPLYPTPVGPALTQIPGPGRQHSPPPPGYMEPSPMYAGGAPPRGRALDFGGGSPAMGSLPRPAPFDERERDRGPRTQAPAGLGTPLGSGHALTAGTSTNMSAGMMGARQPQILSGPGAVGLGAPSASGRDRDREREREKDRVGGGAGESAGGRRERERQQMNNRERERERDWPREVEGPWMMQGAAAPMDAERERDRERYLKQAQMREPPRGEQMWSRFVRMVGSGDDERERGMMNEAERDERERYMEAEEARMREAREADGRWDVREDRWMVPRERHPAKEKDPREKERERERDDRRIGRPGTGREEQAEERERAAREGEGAWAKDLERGREREQRERAQRERERDDVDAMRAQRQAHPSAPQHVHLHHHHHPELISSNSAHSSTSLSSSFAGGPQQSHALGSKASQVPPTNTGGGHSGVGPGDLQPFPMPQERLQQQQQSGPPFRQGPSQMANGSSPGSSLSMPPHQYPHPHVLPQHPQSGGHMHPPSQPHPHAYGTSPFGFPQHRRTPPPVFHPSVSSSGPLFVHPRTPSPPIPPRQLPPLHLGTFVHPRTPFPYLDFPEPGADLREIRVTILLPSAALPPACPAHPRIWGGAPIPALGPAAAPHRPHPLELQRLRRVYTDDSDLFLCALHAGLVSWRGTARARGAGQDLRLELRLTREARYKGGRGAAYGRAVEERADAVEDDGRSLMSAGWGNSHDGAGIEVLGAEFVQAGTARAMGVRNRAQRLLEYAERRTVLCGYPPHARKRRRVDSSWDSAVRLAADRWDRELCAKRTITFGGAGLTEIGFKHGGVEVKGVLFAQVAPGSDVVCAHKRKRAHSPAADVRDADGDCQPADAPFADIEQSPISERVPSKSNIKAVPPPVEPLPSDPMEQPSVTAMTSS
ncbi:hypothetical protein B0H21DRAFT_350318 [Amylocystis lapponica]|nr:hypothetical protein B0H21DRAFT_350318 [Amylocystis lapponica]